MAQSNNHRLLQLRELLFNETDEEHELNLQEITEKLFRKLEIEKVDYRTIKKDIESLQGMDFDIVQNRHRHGKIFYSHQEKFFETYQLRTLVDAVLSARFIAPKEKVVLIDTLKKLTSIHVRKTLPEPILFSQSINVDYNMIKLNIDHVHHAITNAQVLSYRYGDYNVDKEFEHRRNGEYYLVEPYALIWQNDLYYLIGKFQKTNQLRHYRLDRMRDITNTETRFVKDRTFELQSYVDNSFQMFSGQEAHIKIRFRNVLLNAIYDRFGLSVDVKEDGEDHFILSTKAKISDGLLGWILQWGTGAEVISPSTLLESVCAEINKMAEIYK